MTSDWSGRHHAGVSEDSPYYYNNYIRLCLYVCKKADRVPPATGSWHRGPRWFYMGQEPTNCCDRNYSLSTDVTCHYNRCINKNNVSSIYEGIVLTKY